MADTQPETAKPARQPIRFHAIVTAIPAISLGFGLWLLIFKGVPTGNVDVVKELIAGLLGYLAHAGQSALTKPKTDA